MKNRIGELAGKVWHALENNGSMTLPYLIKKMTGVNQSELLIAIGWLAREDQVDLSEDKGSIRISLTRAMQTK